MPGCLGRRVGAHSEVAQHTGTQLLCVSLVAGIGLIENELGINRGLLVEFSTRGGPARLHEDHRDENRVRLRPSRWRRGQIHLRTGDIPAVDDRWAD
jgi:hypothetical protein